MKKGNLREKVSDHFESKVLSKHQLESLNALQDVESKEHKNVYERSFKIVTLMFFVVLTLVSTFYFLADEVSLEEKIGMEVAKNHIKLKPLEIETSEMQDIRDYFTQLEFVPTESKRLAIMGNELLGGRYCSIQGITATQLRIKDKTTGEVQTLYQTVYNPEVFSGLPKLEDGGQPHRVYSKGIEVDIWVEKGIVFALTRNSDKR